MPDQISDGPLTPSERKELRRMIAANGHRKWLRSVIQSSAAWIAGVITSIYLFYDFIAAAVRRIVGLP